jgi:hypothetical protein
MRKLLLFVVAAALALSACSAVDPSPSCSATCHDRYPEQSRERAAFTGANTAWSRAVVLQEQAQDERAAAIVRAEEAERKLAAVAELQRSTAVDLEAARAQLRLVSAGPADVWRWQGDGHDDPASLACPVVMSAATLREFVAARELAAKRYAEAEDVIRTDGLQIVAHQERIATLEATNERLRKRASEHLDAAGLRTLYDALEDDNMHTEAAMVQRLANGMATPPPGTVAALLRAARDWYVANGYDVRLRSGMGPAMLALVRAIEACNAEPSPLDRAVGEVCAVDVAALMTGGEQDMLITVDELNRELFHGTPAGHVVTLRKLGAVALRYLAAHACDAPATKEPG